MLLIWMTAAALAAEPLPLVVAADTAAADLSAWWRPGELVLQVRQHDQTTTVRPLAGPDPVAAPADWAGWSAVSPETCAGPSPTHPQAAVPASSATVHLLGEEVPTLELRDGDVVRAVGSLGRPAVACALRVAEADALPGPEILLAWATPDGQHQGITVWHIPEAALAPSPAPAPPSSD